MSVFMYLHFSNLSSKQFPLLFPYSLLLEHLFDNVWRLRVVEVNRREAQRVDESGRLEAVCLQQRDARTHVDGRLLVERASVGDVVVEDDRARHRAEGEHHRLLLHVVLVLLVVLHRVAADVRHRRERGRDAVLADGVAAVGEEVRGGRGEHAHHRRRERVKQRHLVGQVVADLDAGVLLGELHAAQRAAVIREVVLDSGIDHLRVVKAQHKIKHVAELLGKCLLVGESVFGVV